MKTMQLAMLACAFAAFGCGRQSASESAGVAVTTNSDFSAFVPLNATLSTLWRVPVVTNSHFSGFTLDDIGVLRKTPIETEVVVCDRSSVNSYEEERQRIERMALIDGRKKE